MKTISITSKASMRCRYCKRKIHVEIETEFSKDDVLRFLEAFEKEKGGDFIAYLTNEMKEFIEDLMSGDEEDDEEDIRE